MSTIPKGNGARGRAFTTDAKHINPEAHDNPPGTGAEQSAVAGAQTTALSSSVDYGEDAGLGMEDIEQGEMLIPFVRIVQPTAGVLKENSPNYDPDVKQGMIANTSAGIYYPRAVGFGFIPCFREGSYTEWVPIDQGGGFRGTWAHDDARVSTMLKEQGSFKALKTPDGTELVETRTIYGVVVPRDANGAWLADQAQAGVMAFTSTQIKKYRDLVTRLNALVGQPKPRFPMFCWRWNVTTVPEKNKKGDYYGWKISLAADTADGARMLPSDPLYQMARDVHNLVKAGGAKADFAQSEVHADAEGSIDRGSRGPTIDQTGQQDVDSEIPF